MFTIADAIVGVVLLVSAGMAFLRGFVHEVLAIAAWIGAVVATLYGYDIAEPWVAQQISITWAAHVVTGVGLFLTSLLILSLVTKAVSDQVRKSALNSVDSSLGFLFGLIRGALLVSIGYYICAQWIFEPSEMPGWLETARTRPWLDRGAHLIEKWRPRSLGGLQAEETGPSATGDLAEDARMDSARKMETLVTPKADAKQAGSKNGKVPAAGYDKEERTEMDRLIKSNQ